LPGLKDLGLVSIQKQGKLSILRAESPEKLLKYLELKVKEVNYEYQFLLDHKKELLEDFSREPQDDLIMVINNFKKLTSFFNILINKNSEILFFSHGSVISKAGFDYYQEFFDFKSVLKEKLISTKELLEFNNISQEYRNKNYSEFQKIQLFGQDDPHDLNRVDKIIGQGLILIILVNKSLAIIIKEETIISLEKHYFNLLWNSLIKQAA